MPFLFKGDIVDHCLRCFKGTRYS